jgi:hypothetical protein
MFMQVPPEESYSRQLDHEVAASEMPYGYDSEHRLTHERSESPAYEEAEESALREGKRRRG